MSIKKIIGLRGWRTMHIVFISLLFMLLHFQASWAQQAPLPEVMDAKQLLFDGKLQRFFSVQAFEAHFQKPDSTVLLIDVQPCSYIFEHEDGSKDVSDEYWYKDGSRFERNEDRMAVDEFRFTNGHFILYDGLKLSSSTTVLELKKHFPNAVKAIGTLDVQDEGKLQVIILREDDQNLSDGQIRLFFKGRKLYFMHWWFPC